MIQRNENYEGASTQSPKWWWPHSRLHSAPTGSFTQKGYICLSYSPTSLFPSHISSGLERDRLFSHPLSSPSPLAPNPNWKKKKCWECCFSVCFFFLMCNLKVNLTFEKWNYSTWRRIIVHSRWSLLIETQLRTNGFWALYPCLWTLKYHKTGGSSILPLTDLFKVMGRGY